MHVLYSTTFYSTLVLSTFLFLCCGILQTSTNCALKSMLVENIESSLFNCHDVHRTMRVWIFSFEGDPPKSLLINTLHSNGKALKSQKKP